jgi:hypothetical protein
MGRLDRNAALRGSMRFEFPFWQRSFRIKNRPEISRDARD